MLREHNEAWFLDILANHYEEALARANSLLLEVPQDEETGCLLTPTTRARKVRFHGHQLEAYRFVYCVANRVALPWRVVVRHRCHNRTCINPHHLTQGDRRDNKRDDWARAAYGVDHALLPRG
jgi:hypothetical protein